MREDMAKKKLEHPRENSPQIHLDVLITNGGQDEIRGDAPPELLRRCLLYENSYPTLLSLACLIVIESL